MHCLQRQHLPTPEAPVICTLQFSLLLKSLYDLLRVSITGMLNLTKKRSHAWTVLPELEDMDMAPPWPLLVKL